MQSGYLTYLQSQNNRLFMLKNNLNYVFKQAEIDTSLQRLHNT